MLIKESLEKMSRVYKVLMPMVIFLKISSAVNEVCSGLYCYNGGSLSFENGMCVCLCPPKTTGLLCGQELKESMWPPGPYAVPMVRDGCPEDYDRGWQIGRIKIVTKYSMSESDSFMGCKNERYNNETNETFPYETNASISGYVDKYELQMNLCLKMPHYISSSGSQWPVGNYSIYGVNQTCPPDFNAHNLTVCFPPTRTLTQLKSLPVFSISFGDDNYHTYLHFTICTRKPEENDPLRSWNVEHPFSFLKVSEKECQDINGYDSSPSTLSPHLEWLLSGQPPFMFCLYLPDNYVIGEKYDHGIYNADPELRSIFNDFYSLMYVAVNFENISCGEKPKGFPSSYCGVMQKLTLDADSSMDISGVLFRFDSIISQYQFRRRTSFMYVFTSKQRIFSSVMDALLCQYNEHSWVNSETDLVVALICNRSFKGRYVTIYTQEDILSSSYITILSQATTSNTTSNSSVVEFEVTTCYSDMGMRDFRIQDFQLGASSTLKSHAPNQARPQYSGWCSGAHDPKPFLQIDLLSANVIEGIVLSSWMEIEEIVNQNVYSYSLREYGKQPIFLEYAVSNETFMRYNHEPWYVDLSHSVDEPRTYLFENPVIARFLRVYPLMENEEWKSTCMKVEILGCREAVPSRQSSVYFTLFNDILLNVYTSKLMVNNSFHLASEDVPFTSRDNQVFRWDITASSESFLLLQFTEINLRSPVQEHNTDQVCEDILVVTRNDIPTRTVTGDLYYGFSFVFDYRYNGRFPTIPVPYSNIILEFRTCTLRENMNKSFRRFSVMISEKGSRPQCYQNQLCSTIPTTLTSPSFLGHLIEFDNVYVWTFYQMSEPNSVIRILDFDISCSSGTRFFMKEMNIIVASYCNKNRTYAAIPANSNIFTVEYSTEVHSCDQSYFREGFSLSFEKGLWNKDINIQNLTSSKIEYRENQPIWIETFMDRYDVRYWMPNNGLIRKVCSNYFQKCYRIYFGLSKMDVGDSIRLCADRNSSLVNLRSILEMEYVREIVLQWMRDAGFKSFTLTKETPTLLIGLLRYKIGNKYRHYWSDGSIADFTAWDKNEPNDIGTRLCTSMTLYGKGGWKTEICHEYLLYSIVCEDITNNHINPPRGLSLSLEVKSDGGNDTLTYLNYLLFTCNNGEFVSRLARCNGIGECIDGSDEEGCLDDGNCEKDEFKCDEGQCIHVSRVCDNMIDCNDLTDEECFYKPCESDQFRCDNGNCRSSSERCNGIKDCTDGTDELNCEYCEESTRCEQSMICIPHEYTCNGVMDCLDGSDEHNCDSEIKTCDDFLLDGATRNVIFMSGGSFIRCEFYVDTILNSTYVTMSFLNVDWSFQKKREYYLEPYWFIKEALQNDYKCSQQFTHQPRRNIQIVNNIFNESDIPVEQIDLNYTLLESNGEYRMSNTKTFEVRFSIDTLQLRFLNSFDEANSRITIGPIQCFKESPSIFTIPCEDGTRSVDEALRCVYDVDSELNVRGCRNLNHIENCTDFICPEQYVKCPQSYCILPNKVCDGFMDCPHGEDELDCWCEDDEKTFVILLESYSKETLREKACKLAGQLYSPSRTVLVVSYHIDTGKTPFLTGQMVNSKSGHCLYHDSYQFYMYLYPLSMWSTWSFNMLQKFNTTFQNSKSSNLILMTQSMLTEGETILSDFIRKYMESFDSNVTIYNIRADPTIQSNIKVVQSDVIEILVRSWKLVDEYGPWLFKDECAGIRKTCRQGYRCLQSRVCIQLNQLCDGSIQCPFGDDEMNCNFQCPTVCNCGLLTMTCKDTNTNLTVYDLHITDSIRNLDLSGTNTFGKSFLTAIASYERAIYIISLNVSRCKIPTISQSYFYGVKNLRTLDLSLNLIQRLTVNVFSHLRYLTSLYLHGNSFLSYIEPGSLNGLHVNSLDLTGCGLLSISMNTFVDLTLNDIDLSFNQIDKIEDLAFNKLSARHLKLQGNKISVFTKRMFEGLDSLERLNTPAYKFCCIRPLYLNDELCLPHKDEFSSCADLMRNPILQALLWIIGSLALLGNISSLVYRLRFKDRLKIGYGIFVTNLAVSDMLMGLYMFIIAVADSLFRGRYIEVDTYWRSSNWCRLAGVLSTLSSEASVLFVAFITIDRILVIKFPFGNIRLTARKAIVASVVIWISVMLLSILPLLYVEYFSDSFYSKSAVCLALPLTRDRPPGWMYSISIFIAFNFVMFVLIALGQLLIYTEIKKQTHKSKRMNVTRRNDLKVARNLLLLVSTDFLCWFPIGLMGLMAMNGYVIPGDVYAWTAVLVLPINSALNPFLYTLSAILNKKSFNPNLDEQEHENFTKESSESVARIISYFYRGHFRGLRHDSSLANTLDKRPLIIEEVLLITMDIAKGLSLLHDENLVMKKLNTTTVGIRASSDVIENAYFNEPPRILSSKKEKTEDIYQFGALINDTLHGVGEN